MGEIVSALIGAGSKLLGGFMSDKATEKQNRINAFQQAQANALAAQEREQDRALQREFAQTGIRWRVADAMAAAKDYGIHPIYALGGSGASYTPSSISVGTSPGTAATGMASALSSMGQDVGRAVTATMRQEERDATYNAAIKGLALQKGQLENELLQSQIARLKGGQMGPPMGSAKSDKTKAEDGQAIREAMSVPLSELEERQAMVAGGRRWLTSRRYSDQQVAENRYGESADWIEGVINRWKDIELNNAAAARDAMQEVGGLTRMPSWMRRAYGRVRGFAHRELE